MQAVEVVYATVPGCPAPSTLRDKLRAFALAFFREAPPDFHADLVLQIDNFAFQYTPTHSLLSDLPKINRISEPMNEKEVHMNAEEKMVRAVKKAAKKALAEAVIQQSAEAKASPVS
jgi:hypothetical protein